MSLVAGCVVGVEDAEIRSSNDRPSFEEFVDGVYQEPGEHGAFIVNGDTAMADLAELRRFYDSLYDGQALIVHSTGNVDSVWSDSMKNNLTYCVSDSFGNRKQQVIDALQAATTGWELAADIDFVHLASEDDSCTSSNSNVVFDIRPVSGQPYLARAFFPHYGRSSSNVLIDSSSFGYWEPLSAILTHELGHVLGFRHEHTRPEAGQCYEDSSWRPLTPYDSSSVMHYPQCGGSGGVFQLSAYDKQGAADIYGGPANGSDGGESDGGDTEPPPQGTSRTATASAELDQDEWLNYQAIAVTPGTAFNVSITGTGDADLYLRFGAAATPELYDCRPFIDGSAESCSVTVPSDQTEAFVSVHGYAAATYELSAAWTGP
jgi:hypothetical protein